MKTQLYFNYIFQVYLNALSRISFIFQLILYRVEAYSESCQIFKKEHFAKIVSSLSLYLFSQKCSILAVWECSEYVSAFFRRVTSIKTALQYWRWNEKHRKAVIHRYDARKTKWKYARRLLQSEKTTQTFDQHNI